MEENEKNKGGRPGLWETEEDFINACDGFFSWCQSGDEFLESIIPDIEALTTYLGTSRKVLCEYEKKPKFSNAIKEIKEKIAFYKKQLALTGRIPSAVFCFDFKNNHEYADKTEVDHTSKGDSIQPRITFSNG